MIETQAARTAMSDAEPTALGLNAGGWVALAMIAVIGIMIWQRVPALIAGILDKRIGEIKDQLASAAKLRAEAEALKAEYDAKLAALTADAAGMRDHAEQEAKLIVAQAHADTEALIKRRTQMATDKIAAAERAAIAAVRARAAEAATAAARKLIIDGHNSQHDNILVSDAIAHLS